MLYSTKNVYGQAKGQANNDVDAQADSCQERAEQPEALTEAFTFRRCYAARCPEWPQQVLKYEKKQRGGDVNPVRKEGGVIRAPRRPNV